MNTVASLPPSIDVDRIRRHFPGLAADTVLLENAGGSQVPALVADAIRDYMTTSFVQLGTGYDVANRADAVVDEAHELVLDFVNGRSGGRVILGPSCTQLVTMLAGSYASVLAPGDEVIVTEAGHEANIGPWMKLADRGITVRIWPVDPETMTCRLETLADLLGPRTRLVALVHVSNLLGEIIDVAAAIDLVHAAGGRVVVDGVAYAPHRAIDVEAIDADWYVYSTYKVYGPHMAALYGSHEALAELTGPNHFFVPREEVPYKFELGGVNHEGCAGVNALAPYLADLATMKRTADASRPIDRIPRSTIVDAYEVMTACELPLQGRLISYLRAKPGVRLIGPAHGDASRVPTVSFVHETKASQEIATFAHTRGIGIRNGHMYAHRLCSALGVEPEDGVVRISAVHYNTMDEIERLLEALDEIL